MVGQIPKLQKQTNDCSSCYYYCHFIVIAIVVANFIVIDIYSTVIPNAYAHFEIKYIQTVT